MQNMKINLLTIILAFIGLSSFAQTSLEGNYQGKNLYIQNPQGEDMFGFCVTNVTVNGNPIVDGIESSAFEINFENMGIKMGEKVEIVIEHDFGCKPKILNPEVLKPKSTYEIQSINVGPDGLLQWSTTNERGKLPYIIEQFRWNKWVRIGEVNGEGSPESHSYKFKVDPHSGENRVRVAQIDHTGKKRPSKAVTFQSKVPEVTMSPMKVSKAIYFKADGSEAKTRYEIYDAYGNIVKKGAASEVDCDNLRKGAYYINYDNKVEKFLKK